MLRSSKSKLWSMFCGGLLAGWLVSCLLPPSPTSAETKTGGVPFAELDARLKAAEAKLSLFSADEGTVVLKGDLVAKGEIRTYRKDVQTTSINGLDPTKGIIAILDCSPELGSQSLTVKGPVLLKGENGSSVQINDCHDPNAPAVQISVAPAGEEGPNNKTALLVTGPASNKPLVEFSTVEPINFEVESVAPVQVINPWLIPTLPMFFPKSLVGLQVNGRDGEANLSPDGMEIGNRLLATHSCLNSIELLVRCGPGNVSPAGIRMNPETGETSVYAEQINGVNGGFNSLFSGDITTFHLTEITGTDNP